jgi:hypothetical protein
MTPREALGLLALSWLASVTPTRDKQNRNPRRRVRK